MRNRILPIGLLAGILWVAVAACGAVETTLDKAPAGGPEVEKAVDKPLVLQTTCPVTGEEINKNLYVDHDGKRIYVCCKGCEGKIKQDPAAFIKKLEDAGITVATLQTTCPVMGGAIDKALYVDHAGKRIYVCCAGCIAKIKEDPAKVVKTLEASGIVLAPAGKTNKPAEPKKEEAKGHEGHNH